ncbi:unnamed protein product [Miscanthus lutarioriparius]|uniref:F-box domain-containing protein n=1 Tax=Miscanthus lutarioriparius TaxID=422564 RepID=A0A811P9F0_9POAL|nr:unnamed protein product [Miscanthus lutarioriparius]
MPGDPEPMAETSGAMVVAPARVPRAEPGINDLPRDLLPRVLSCLDAREAVQTCVLSKLWRDLWRDARRINASCPAFEIDGGGLDDHGRSLFKEFVNRLLMLRNPVSLDEFRLWYYIDGDRLNADAAEPNLWIRHALLCEARSVEIFAWHDKLELNPAVFTSEHLTSLLLYSVVLTNGFFKQLQNGCKTLERLILQECPINDIEIASQTIKFLSIGHICWFHPRPYDPAHQPSLSLPNLIHLGFFDHLAYDGDRIPLVKNMESLQTAYIDLLKYNDLPVDDIRQFLLGLSGVTKLEFCFGFGQEELMMGMDLQWCPKFNNLKFLSLVNWYLDANFYGLIAFLQNSPNLEHLTLSLKLKQHAKVPGALMGWAGNRLFTCEHLKTVEIICSKDDPAVHSLREFLLAGGISDGQIHIKH